MSNAPPDLTVIGVEARHSTGHAIGLLCESSSWHLSDSWPEFFEPKFTKEAPEFRD